MARPQLSFATINLQNLQLPGEPMYPDGQPWTVEQYQAKVAWTAQVVRLLRADVIGFQELWQAQALTDVFTAAGLADQYQLLTPDTTNRIANALALRAPHELVAHEWIVEFPERFRLFRTGESAAGSDYTLDVDIRDFSRPLLHAQITAHQGRHRPEIHVFSAHLKSKAPTLLMDADRDRLRAADEAALGSTLSTIRRAAEAAALRLILNDVMDGATPVVVMGDLNDAQLSVTTSVVSGEPSYRQFAASRAGAKSDRGLYAAANLQQYRSLRDVYYTYIHEGVHESLDHVLVSQHFYDYADARLWSFRQMRILNDHVEDAPPEFDASSDHAPVVTTFDFNPQRD